MKIYSLTQHFLGAIIPKPRITALAAVLGLLPIASSGAAEEPTNHLTRFQEAVELYGDYNGYFGYVVGDVAADLVQRFELHTDPSYLNLLESINNMRAHNINSQILTQIAAASFVDQIDSHIQFMTETGKAYPFADELEALDAEGLFVDFCSAVQEVGESLQPSISSASVATDCFTPRNLHQLLRFNN